MSDREVFQLRMLDFRQLDRGCKNVNGVYGWGITGWIKPIVKLDTIIMIIDLHIIPGGEGGIRTRVGVTNPLTAFEAAPL